MFSTIDFETPIDCDNFFCFDHLQEHLTFFCNQTGSVIKIDSTPREISPELFEEARVHLQQQFPGTQLVWRTRVRQQGQTGELYSKFPFTEGSPEQRILSDVPFFPNVTPVLTQEGYVFVGEETSVTISILDESDNEVKLSSTPTTWCELAEKLYEGLEGWFLTITVTENGNDYEMATLSVADATELAKAKLTIDLYTTKLK